MKTIRGFCFTNIDRYKDEVWPYLFCGIPRIGDLVQSKSKMKLKVVSVTHCFDFAQEDHCLRYNREEELPVIKIELHF
jgi:hypothetical protein